MLVVANLALTLGDGTVRVTPEQNFLFRWVSKDRLPDLYLGLAAAGLWLPDAGSIADVTSCPGAESCRLAVTQSRGLGRLIADQLRARPNLINAARDVKIKISGCPNGCGQHHVADIGFQGSVRRLGGRALPQYFVMLGGGVDENGAHFGRLVAKIPARRIPDAVERLISLYERERLAGETASEFLRRVQLPRAKEALADLEQLAQNEAKPEDFIDLGEQAEFVPETQEGECAA
jgi:sulfite reductase (NADPH) hemoprotein beta-component